MSDSFTKQVEADAIACGWPPAAAALLAKFAGKPPPTDARSGPQQRRGPVGKSPAVFDHAREIAALLRACKLPAGLQDDLRAARVLTFQSARTLCASVVGSANPKVALERLRLHLFTKARHA
jgi:hypothetical protein